LIKNNTSLTFKDVFGSKKRAELLLLLEALKLAASTLLC